MRNIVTIILIGVLLFWSTAFAQENPCDGKKLTICEKNPEGNPICQILKQDATETVDSIIQFLRAITKHSYGDPYFNDEEQEQLICGRLMGRKRIESLGSISDNLKRRFSYYSGRLSYRADFDYESTFNLNLSVEPLIVEWISLEEKADRVLPDYIVCPENPNFAFVLQGDVTKVDVTDLTKVNKSYFSLDVSIEMKNVSILDRSPIETRMQFLRQKMDQHMKDVLSFGLNGHQISGSTFVHDMRKLNVVLVDDVGFSPLLTSMSQLELVRFDIGKGDNPPVEEVLEEAYCGGRSIKLGQRHAEWIQEHVSVVPEEFTKYTLLFPGTVWRYPSGSELLISCLIPKCCERRLNGTSYRYWEFKLCEKYDKLNSGSYRFLRFSEQ